MNLYEKHMKGETADHFLGPIVFKTVEEKIGQITRRIVIDGQQRLTTLLLLCALIRDRARVQGNTSLVDKIEQNFLFNKYATTNEDKPRLRLTKADKEIFEKIINGEDPRAASGSQLTPAYSYFENLLEGKEDQISLEKLLDVITGLKLVTIRLEEKDNPNRIFETLNYRGKELAQSDLVRNFFMMSIRDNAKAEQLYNDRWFPMELGFGGDAKERTENLELFLRHYLTMLKHATVKEDRIYAEIRDRLKLADENNVISELNSMSRYAVYYQRLLFPQKETNNIIAKGIDRLNRFGISVHYPFLLKVYNAFEAGKVSVADFNIILKTIESYYVRRFFMQLPTNALNKLFALLCSLPDDNLASALQAELASKEPTSTAYWPDDKDFKEKFVLLPVYRDTDRCQFVLESLEESFAHPEPVTLTQLTIEHVMPETLTDEWKNYLGENWKDVHNRYVHTVGNLTLVARSPNSALQNKLFEVKREQWYKNSNVQLTRELAEKWNEWKEKEILERANLLAERALRIWPRPKHSETTLAEKTL
jgi:uncharacterized protein with ParB-like and HNH nuclease domain